MHPISSHSTYGSSSIPYASSGTFSGHIDQRSGSYPSYPGQHSPQQQYIAGYGHLQQPQPTIPSHMYRKSPVPPGSQSTQHEYHKPQPSPDEKSVTLTIKMTPDEYRLLEQRRKEYHK
ncbi:hypothetical protein ADUPG1_000395 [Aduncisulcus paluster]|uniref:Uncharacterized protein n=1 Tax=Aduncisulcus paluster TaxID=2918883 RepID=A0ABQ5K7X6_9EUKA|nr:hypothetical protein ADUPG1_000395 [Aduncisulcus paluster]|eukprot:gnl/Carplike_NY0171/3982_a5380_402.p1 GENE.gnl/Carplike_NY0171/3982_a5380_402~~gnl/Carplike_NY0171/3982_a5380_402.p1  ORF type:complete len:118 (+),score=19.18 gnl/Carplike_NY0171/3982_a5380_402:79-432(+)